MHYNFKQKQHRSIYHLNSFNFSIQRLFRGFKLSLQIFCGLSILISFSSNALIAKTQNEINGHAPYLTFDGGQTEAVDASDLLWITLSNGVKYTPSTNISSPSVPIVLPVEGQSFADINMLVPTNNSGNYFDIEGLIGSSYDYFKDNDGDEVKGIRGSIWLSLFDRKGAYLSRNTVLNICDAPYKITLSTYNVKLYTRYGIPNTSKVYSDSSVNYYISPKSPPVVCLVSPQTTFDVVSTAAPDTMWISGKGFLPQSTDPSRYGLNFPTTGMNNIYFDLIINGVYQALSWSPVSQGGITATMSNSTANSVHVTLTGPFATESQKNSTKPGRILTPSLPQTFELVGRDSRGNAVLKYGFTLKQWFIHRNNKDYTYPKSLSWCNRIGYRLAKVKDLTNATRPDRPGVYIPSATPHSPYRGYMRHIGGGFLAEWGDVHHYTGIDTFGSYDLWTSDQYGNEQFIVRTLSGEVDWIGQTGYPIYGLCVSH